MRAFATLAWIAAASVAAAAATAEAGAPPGVSEDAAEAITLVESDQDYQRQLGFLRLEALREPGTAPYVRGYLTHAEPTLRAFSIRAVVAIEGASAIPDALTMLAGDRYPDVRRAALLSVEPFEASDPAILPAMLDALRDPHPDVRITAVDAVSRINNGRAREAILERNRREHDRNVRRALELAMKRLGP